VRAQLLDAPRPTDLVAVVAAADPAADRPDRGDRAERRPRRLEPPRLGRTGPTLKQALEQDRTLFELDALIRPIGDLGLYLAGAPDRPATSEPDLAPRQRPLPARRPEAARQLRAR
jgi:hypothetical protein